MVYATNLGFIISFWYLNIAKTTTSPPQSHLWRALCHPSWWRMDSSASFATSCTMLTADESSHSAVGMLHAHRSATCILYVRLALCCLISQKEMCPFTLGISTLNTKKVTTRLTIQNDIIGIHTVKYSLEQWKMKTACNSARQQLSQVLYEVACAELHTHPSHHWY